MPPFPTLEDSIVIAATGHPSDVGMHECCAGVTTTPAAAILFTCCGDEDSANGGDRKRTKEDGDRSSNSSLDDDMNGRRVNHDESSTSMVATSDDDRHEQQQDVEDVMSLDRLFCPLSRICGDSCGRGRSAVTMIRRTATKPNGQMMMASQPVFYTDVVVVGNGPSALALSSFLAGYRPYYDGTVHKHPDADLHAKLDVERSKSLLEQDLSRLCEGLEGRTSHQVSLLYDYLVRPEADFGQENPSTLSWRRETNPAGRCQAPGATPGYVPHVVLGKGAVGGTWADLAPEVMTLSFASWLDLPAYSFRDWLVRDGANFATDLQMKIDASKDVVGRVPCAAVRRYYRDYVRALKLDENIFEYALITSVRKRDSTNGDEEDAEYPWDVYGCYSGGCFHFRCRRVVLATGVTVPRQLGIEGEDDQRVLHTSAQLDRAITELRAVTDSIYGVNGGVSSSCGGGGGGGHRKRASAAVGAQDRIGRARTPDPVLVIGDGLNAADAVIKCLIHGIPVVHSFRKTPRDSQQILSKLSKLLYPEYHTVFQLMTGAAKDPLYTVHPRTQVQRFEYDNPPSSTNQRKTGGGEAVLRNIKNASAIERIRFSRVAVLIGFEADLSFMDMNNNNTSRPVDSKSNTLNVDPITCRCRTEPNLYAIGPLIGDNFVRYVVGGSMAAAADIIRRSGCE